MSPAKASAQAGSGRPAGLDPATLEAMEARSAAELPEGDGWRFEPKWDGFRCLAFRDGDAVDLRAKSGKPLGRYFPEMVALLGGLRPSRFVLDGELVIALDEGLSFDHLQMRLHPAQSRIKRLSTETPASLILFDMLLTPRGRLLRDRPLTERREALETFAEAVAVPDRLILSPWTEDREAALHWLEDAGRGATDGVVAKRADEPYQPGERAMVKVKRLRTADCVVGGFRYLGDRRQVGSLLLGLYDEDGRLDHVGFTATIADTERAELTARLEALRGEGFSGKAPGGPNRWSTERTAEWEPLRPELVVEVRFDHVTGRRFRHGTRLMRWRPDKAPRQCTFAQLAPAAPEP